MRRESECCTSSANGPACGHLCAMDVRWSDSIRTAAVSSGSRARVAMASRRRLRWDACARAWSAAGGYRRTSGICVPIGARRLQREDLHWIDEATQELLNLLADS